MNPNHNFHNGIPTQQNHNGFYNGQAVNQQQLYRPNGDINGQASILQTNQLNRQQISFRPGGIIGASPSNIQQLNQNKQLMQQQRVMGTFPPQNLAKAPQSEICLKHNENNVAFNNHSREIVCNSCIFENKMGDLKFTAVVVKEIQEKFAKEFENYRSKMSQMTEADVGKVKIQISELISSFLLNLKQTLTQFQLSVAKKIENSENLKNLDRVFEQNKDSIQTDPQQPNNFEKEKKIFDEKINKGRFAYVVKRQDFYKGLIENLDKSRLKMKQTIDESLTYQSKILHVNNNERLIQEKLAEIMKDCISIDSLQPEAGLGLKLIRSNTAPHNQMGINNNHPVQHHPIPNHIMMQNRPMQMQQQQQQPIQQFNQMPIQNNNANLSPTRMQVENIQRPNGMMPLQMQPLQQPGQLQQQTLINQMTPQQFQMQQQQQQQQLQQQQMMQRQGAQASPILVPNQQMVPLQMQNMAQQLNRPPIQQMNQMQQPVNLQQTQQIAPNIMNGQIPPQQFPQMMPNQQQWRPVVQNGQQINPQMNQQIQFGNIQQVPQQIPQVIQQQAIPQSIQQQNMNDEVLITGSNFKKPNILEYQYNTFFKLKSMNLLRLIPGQVWQKYHEHQQLLLAKCVFTLDERVFVVGGARDQKAKETLADLIEHKQTGDALVTNQRASMITSRASFGCVYSPVRNEIIVAGGYDKGEVTKKCERYSLQEISGTHSQIQLRPMLLSLCILDSRYLYSIGGLSKNNEASITLQTSIERLDLKCEQGLKWTQLQMRLNEAACDVGCLPLSSNEMLIFGGWNKNPLQGTYIIKNVSDQQAAGQIVQPRQDPLRHELKPLIDGGIDRADFFMISGIAMQTGEPNKIKVCGHTQLFTFDIEQRKFLCSSSV
uniref:Macronuclear development protein 3 n=1 Tax=Stylonychia lemnae TaxID=5949 RepID=Q8ISG6_STYLE|nr:macronuclear development protein 3 [Stylonychia lemnae]AAP20881.1 macronuclear development protein 3 [Stylonychia lemnae]